jgi:RNA polymerase sigma-70 factor (ECF subfamily)
LSKTQSERTIEDRQLDDSLELVRALQAEKQAAFDTLVLRYKDRIFNLCYRLLGDYHEADDTAQDVFIKVYRHIKGFRFESAFSTWLYQVAINTCKNKLTSSEFQNREKMVRLHNPSQGDDDFKDIEDKNISPLAVLEKRERTLLIHKAIQALPNEQKEVIVLRDIQGLSYEEIALATGQKSGTVKSRIARARLALRQQLKGVI